MAAYIFCPSCEDYVLWLYQRENTRTGKLEQAVCAKCHERRLVREAGYQHHLNCEVRKARKLLAAVGCKLHKSGPYVSLESPDTGSHTLNMSLGVRPVTDLMVHVAGFCSQQPNAKPVFLNV
jgi:hypothetical protein